MVASGDVENRRDAVLRGAPAGADAATPVGTGARERWSTGGEVEAGVLAGVHRALQHLVAACREAHRPLPIIPLLLADDRGLEARLAAPLGRAPQPWTARGHVWRVEFAALPQPASSFDAYPALVHVGVQDGRDVFVDLAAAPGLIEITGPQVEVARVLRHLATGLTASPWSGGVEVLGVGIAGAEPTGAETGGGDGIGAGTAAAKTAGVETAGADVDPHRSSVRARLEGGLGVTAHAQGGVEEDPVGVARDPHPFEPERFGAEGARADSSRADGADAEVVDAEGVRARGAGAERVDVAVGLGDGVARVVPALADALADVSAVPGPGGVVGREGPAPRQSHRVVMCPRSPTAEERRLVRAVSRRRDAPTVLAAGDGDRARGVWRWQVSSGVVTW